MLAYPRVRLSVPNNKSREECAPYSYGIEWEYKPASEGNPFFTAASFRYDETLSEEENRTNAIIFMTNVKKGDYFQMLAEYEYGRGAHSLVFISDYDPATHLVHWTDSNMKGKSVDDERYTDTFSSMPRQKLISLWMPSATKTAVPPCTASGMISFRCPENRCVHTSKKPEQNARRP